jgi:hypothetical protein
MVKVHTHRKDTMQATFYRSHPLSPHRPRRAGISLVWALCFILGLCAVASLAVDLGRVQIVKTQLRAAADAAALAAGRHALSDLSAARRAAVEVAKANKADGSDVVLDSAADVEFVRWDADARTYKPATPTLPANAVRVTARRTAARGNAVDLPFARMFGANTCDVKATAIAMATPQPHAVVGLEYINMKGSARAGSIANDGRGSMASNGSITVGGSASVDGDAHPGPGKSVSGANKVSGSITPLLAPLNYPPADAGKAKTLNDNASIAPVLKKGAITLGSQKKYNVPPGTYYVTGIDLGAQAELHFTGPATLYVAGSINLGGQSKITIDRSPDLKLIVLGSGTVIDFDGGTQIHADIYAPETRIDMHGNSDIFGSIIALSIDVTGNTTLTYDLNLRGGVMLVQ